MFVNVIKTYRDIVAVCDTELLGKKFEKGKFQLDVKENFFRGEEMNEDEVIDLLCKKALEDSTFNIIGRKAITSAIKAGIISEEDVGEIENIPFALVLI